MVTASFKEGQKTAITTSLQKYDYGEVLRIKGLSLPRYVAVQFAVDGMSEALPSSIGETVEDVTDVLIPNSLLRSNIKPWNYNIMAYVYIVSGSSGKTEYTITIPVKWRPKTGDDHLDEDPLGVVGKAVEQVNSAATRAETAASEVETAVEEIAADREQIAQNTTGISELKQDLTYKADKKYSNKTTDMYFPMVANESWNSSNTLKGQFTGRARTEHLIKVTKPMMTIKPETGFSIYLYGNDDGEGHEQQAISTSYTTSAIEIKNIPYKYIGAVVRRDNNDESEFTDEEIKNSVIVSVRAEDEFVTKSDTTWENKFFKMLNGVNPSEFILGAWNPTDKQIDPSNIRLLSNVTYFENNTVVRFSNDIRALIVTDENITEWATDGIINIPTGECRIEFAYKDDRIIDDIKEFLLNVYVNDNKNIISFTNNNDKWKDKNILWLGTSIPAFGYPQIVGEYLGANVINNSLGSSIMRIGNSVFDDNELGDDLGISGMYFQNVVLSLSMTQKERRKLFDCWTTAGRKTYLMNKGYTSSQVANVVGYSEMMAGSFAEASTDTTSAGFPNEKPVDVWANDGLTYKYMRKMSYGACWDSSDDIEGDLSISGKITEHIDGRLEPYIINSDLIVFDHCRNDCGVSNAKTSTQESLQTCLTVPQNRTDRHYIIGAFNYLVEKITTRYPRKKIVICGHYDNDDKRYNLGSTYKVQEKINELYGFPLFKLWECSGIRCNTQITTQGYWDSTGVWHNTGYNGSNHSGLNMENLNENPRLVDNVWVHDLSLRQVWMQDDTHPSSEQCKEHIAKLIADWLKTV